MSVTYSESVGAVRDRLVEHELYERLVTIEAIQVFMKHHVFAVWDFFSLLKRLQCTVTSVDVPWQPPENATYARLINSIVLAEESDEDPNGGYISHFDLYRRAMAEVGADTGPVDAFRSRLLLGDDPIEVVETADLPGNVGEFVGHTLRLALNGEDHEVAASFCYGREDVIPDMFGPVVASVNDVQTRFPLLSYYLERHIALDHDEHGPLAQQLLNSMVGDDAGMREEADRAAIGAIEARIALWDGVLEELDRDL